MVNSMKKERGFTLIELLAVIVILAILLAVAIPRVTQYITNSRKDSFITTAKDFADSVTKDATSETYELPIAPNDVTIVSLNLVKLEKGGKKSPFNAKWVDNNCYVAIINVGTDIDPEYKYFVALTDSKRYAIKLTAADELNTDLIYRRKSSSSDITSLCGSKDGKYMTLGNINGLEKYKNTSWNLTIYSENGC